MKIGIYSPYLDTLTGGEKYIFNAAACLSKDHQVTIFWDDPEILQKASLKFNLNLGNVSIDTNIFSDKTSFLKRYVKTLTYDHILFLSDGSIPIVGSKKLFVHFQFPVEWVDTNSFPFLFKKSRISKIICNSYFTKEYIDRKFNTDSYILYPPVDTNNGQIPKKENVILTVGRFSLFKNGSDFKKLSVMIDAYKSFQKKRLKGWKFVIVTSVRADQEESFAEFEKQIKSQHIIVHKNVAYEQIIEDYKKARIYWHAAGFGEDLKKHPERAEHFGISTAEAMSYGAVPVVIKAGGQPEIVKDNDNGFLWSEIDELVERTHKLAVDKQLYEKMSERAVESSERFTKNRFCEELNHLIW